MFRLRLMLLLTLTVMAAGCGYGSRNYNMGGGGSPAITQLVPNTATANGGQFTLEVDGSGFGTDSVVYWNGAAQASSYGTGGKVTATITAGDIMNPGMVPVYVRSGGTNSNSVTFTVQ